MRVSSWLRAGGVGALGVVALVGLGADHAVRAADRHAPIVIRHVRQGAASSSNWSGYAVTGAKGSVQDVKGSWIVPSVTCNGGTQYASFWVGIDGFNSGTVEQIGTDADCRGGVPTYYAWFEFYPHPMFTINTVAVQPGDVIAADVSYDPRSRQFTVSLKNTTNGQSFGSSTKVNSAQRSSAEWVAEAPSSAGGILPLADFVSVSYSADTAGVNGATGPIGSFGTNNVYEITMVDAAGNPKAVPSSLGNDQSSFSVQWVSAGP
jgi:peptidase A4-like protein